LKVFTLYADFAIIFIERNRNFRYNITESNRFFNLLIDFLTGLAKFLPRIARIITNYVGTILAIARFWKNIFKLKRRTHGIARTNTDGKHFRDVPWKSAWSEFPIKILLTV
jgi:hypothetical protein